MITKNLNPEAIYLVKASNENESRFILSVH